MNEKIDSSSIVKANGLSTEDIKLWDSFLIANSKLSSAFYSYHFTRAVFNAGKDVYICIMKSNHKTIAFFPFQYMNKAMKALGIAERVGGELNDYFGIISNTSLTLSPTELLKYCHINYFGFSHLEESQLNYGLEGSNPTVSPIVNLNNSDDTLNSKQRRKKNHFIKETERRENKAIEDLGEIKFIFKSSDIDGELNNLIHHKQKQYQSTNSKDPLKNVAERDILKNLAQMNEQHCKGIISSLYAGDTWLASHFGLLSKKTMHYWFPVYDPKYLEYSAGRLLIIKMMEHAKENGYSIFDFGAGASQMKSKFSNDSFTVLKGVWRNKSISSFGYQTVLSLGWKINNIKRVLTESKNAN